MTLRIFQLRLNRVHLVPLLSKHYIGYFFRKSIYDIISQTVNPRRNNNYSDLQTVD